MSLARLRMLVDTRFTAGGIRKELLYAAMSLRFASLSRTFGGRARIVAATIALASPGSSRTYRIPVDHQERRVWFEVSELCELEVLTEVFLGGDFQEAVEPAPRTIVDLGSHIGATLQAFHTLYPHARIVGIEANPKLIERLKANTEMVPELEVRNVAVAGHDGTTPLYLGQHSWASSTLQTPSAAAMTEVPALTLQSLLEDLKVGNVDLLKLDLEGAEYEVLAKFDAWERIGTIMLEWHGDITGHPLTDLKAMLPQHKLSRAIAGSVPGRYEEVRCDPLEPRPTPASQAAAPTRAQSERRL